MIHRIAIEMSAWCGNCLSSTEEEQQIIQYGLEVLLDGILKVAALLVIGYVLGCPGEFGLALLAFCSLRYWAGGMHCRTSARCFGAMLLLCLISTYGGRGAAVFPAGVFIGTAAAGYLILFFGAPGLTEKSLDMAADQRRRKRIGALVWITLEYGIIALIGSAHLKGCIFLAVTLEVFSILPCWRNRKKGVKNYVT